MEFAVLEQTLICCSDHLWKEQSILFQLESKEQVLFIIHYLACSSSSTGRSRLATESFDEDGPRLSPKKRSKLVQRSIYAGAAVVAFLVFNQLMPGGLLAETSAGQFVQGIARAVANTIASVSPRP